VPQANALSISFSLIPTEIYHQGNKFLQYFTIIFLMYPSRVIMKITGENR
jgi:hypothetical protein